MGVSENGRTPKSSNSIGISITNHPFWGTPIFGNIHMVMTLKHKFGNIMHSDQPNGTLDPGRTYNFFIRHLSCPQLHPPSSPAKVEKMPLPHQGLHSPTCLYMFGHITPTAEPYHQCSFNHVSSPSFLGLARWLHFSLPMSRHYFDNPPIVPAMTVAASHFDTK